MVVSSLELERRLKDLYAALHLAEGQLEALDRDRRAPVVGGGPSPLRRRDRGGPPGAGGVGGPRRSARRRDLRRRLPRVFRAGDGLPGGLGPGGRPGGGGVRRQQRLPGRAQRDGRDRQPDRVGPGPRRDGGGVRGLARDQRDRDRAVAREADDGLLQAVAGDADRRLGGRGRAPDRRLVRDVARAASSSAASGATAPQFHDLCRWGIESTGSNGSRTLSPVHRDRRGGRADARRRAGHADLARVPATSSAGRATRSTR